MALSSFPFQVAQITFTAFTLENAHSSGCIWDWVKVTDGSTVVQRCGTDSPGTFTSSSNTARVEFHSDSSITKTGFSATISFVCPTGPGPCPRSQVEMVKVRKTHIHKNNNRIWNQCLKYQRHTLCFRNVPRTSSFSNITIHNVIALLTVMIKVC